MTAPRQPHSDAVPRLHYPQAGDGVAVWLAAQRDLFPPDSLGWLHMETLLAEYLLHAQTGTPLPDRLLHPDPEPAQPQSPSRPRLTLLPDPTEEQEDV